jgi:hypothetical protein
MVMISWPPQEREKTTKKGAGDEENITDWFFPTTTGTDTILRNPYSYDLHLE